MTDRLTHRGRQRAEQHGDNSDSDDNDDDNNNSTQHAHGLPQHSTLCCMSILRCGRKKSLYSSKSTSSAAAKSVTHESWYTVAVNRLYGASSTSQSSTSLPSPSSEQVGVLVVEEQRALTTTTAKQAETDKDETTAPETQSSPATLAEAPKTIQVLHSNHQQQQQPPSAEQPLVALPNLIASFSNDALATLETMDDEKSVTSRLFDYTKCIAIVPDTSPLKCCLNTNETTGQDENNNSEDATTAGADLDVFPPIEQHPSDMKVQFVLRMPKKSKVKSDCPDRQRSDVPQNILSKPSRHSGSRAANRKPPGRSRSAGSSKTDSINSNHMEYVVPLLGGNNPMTMASRENSVENLEKLGNNDSWANCRTPIPKRSYSVESSSLDSTTSLSQPGSEEMIPLKGGGNDSSGRINAAATASPTPLKKSESDNGLGYGYGSSDDQQPLTSSDDQPPRSRKQRMGRRQSFVAGSKIERFAAAAPAPTPQPQQLKRAESDEGLGYGYGSSDDQQQPRTGSSDDQQQPRSRKQRMGRRQSFVAGSKIERFAAATPPAQPLKRSESDEGPGYGYGSSDDQQQPRSRKQRMGRRQSFVAGSKIERFEAAAAPTQPGPGYGNGSSDDQQQSRTRKQRMGRRQSLGK
jgi:hypothetical protein